MSESTVQPRDVVGVSLMISAETEAILAWLRDHHPDASVRFRDCYVKVERDHELSFDLAAISACLGQQLDIETFLINLSSYYGRVVIEENLIRFVSKIASESLPQSLHP